MVPIFRRISFASIVCIALAGSAQAQWPSITQQAKPWTRWWWMGSAVDKQNISWSLRQYAKAGFGGVEVVPIYGAKGFENRYVNYLSPQWMQMLDYTVQQSNTLNMGVYISVGTGWPIGGSHVTKEDAASKIIVQQYDLRANAALAERIVVNDPKQKGFAALSTVMGYGANGDAIDLTKNIDRDGSLNYTSATDLKLYAIFNGKTRQAVKRAAPGGEGFTIDHFSKEATANYFKIFDTAFGNSSHGVKGFFNDSYEVYNADWTPAFFQEFQNRRGYDLKKHLNLFFSNAKDEAVARLKSDYRETMSDLMRENFSTVYTDWTHKRKALSINQAHGSPGNLLDLYGAFDVPETETFGSSYFPIKGLKRDSADVRSVDPDPNMLKFASSAAHAYGKPLISSETFTWLTEHFKTSWSQCKPEVDQVFLSGINHVFYHGTTYSPQDAKWPGWLFYASVNFVPNNSLWPHLSGLNSYIARCQSVLQTGVPDNELAIYWPIYDVWNDAKEMDMPLSVHHVDKWLHPTSFYKNVVALQNGGYSLDFVSDRMLTQANVSNGLMSIVPAGGKHKVLLVPACDMMPVSTFENLLQIAKSGGIVVFEQFPKDVPGYHEVAKQRAALRSLISGLQLSATNSVKVANIGKGKVIYGNFKDALAQIQVMPETMTANGLKFIRRKASDATYYFIVNQTANDIDEPIQLQSNGAAVLALNPLDGATANLPFGRQGSQMSVRLQLKSGQSTIVKVAAKAGTTPVYKYLAATGYPIDLTNNKWNIIFKEGGPVLPSAKQTVGVKPWTSFIDDQNTQFFSGTGVYTTSFNIKGKTTDYLLQLDKVYESAKVVINGKDAGLIWSLPFEMHVGKYLKEGKNTISIEVCNLMANRVRYMDMKGEVWRNYHEINFVNINYKNFDASKWVVQPSGLDGLVRLIPLK